MRNKPLPGMMKHSPMKQNEDWKDEQRKPKLTIDNVDLPDLRDEDKNIDLDKGGDEPLRRSGFGPRTAFGGSKNPELDPSRELEDTAE